LKILFFIFFSLVSLFSFSQSKIKGKVTDEQGNPLTGVSVVLNDAQTKATATYSFTDQNGEYQLTTNKTGDFELRFSALSYQTETFAINLSEKQTIEQNATLVYKPIEINEVIINVERPIVERNDTISFLTSAYLQGNEEVMEDLLKKLPGVNVDSEGTIKIGNQEIEKVMIEGEDMFDKGYKLLTKNMPVHPVEKVDILKRHSNNKHLKGVENSEKVAINLTLKEEAKNTWFGNLYPGYGIVSENRYQFSGNVMSFNKKKQHFFITNLNNTGYNATGDISHLIRPHRYNDPGSIGDNQTAHSLMNLSAPKASLKAKRTTFNNAEMLALNNIFTLTNKVKMKLLGFLFLDENNYFRNSYQAFTANGVSFENTEDYKMRRKDIVGFGKLDLTYDITKNQTLEFIGKYNNSEAKNRSNSDFNNNNSILQNLHTESQLIDQKITYTNKIKPKTVLLLTGRYINEKRPQQYGINQFIYQDLFSENADNLRQTTQNNLQYAGFEAHLLDRKKGENLWEFKAGNEFRQDRFMSEFSLFDQKNLIALPSDYQNNVKYETNDLYLKGKYHHQIIKPITLSTTLETHNLNNTLQTTATSTNQNVFFINPSLGLKWDINNKNKVNANYSYNTTNSGVLNVYDNYLHNGFRSFSKGMGKFNQLDQSSLSFNYDFGGWTDRFHVNWDGFYSKNHDFFSTNTDVAQNYSQSETILIKNREMYSTSVTVDRYLKFISSNLKLKFSYFESEYKNIVNGSDFRHVTSNSFDYGVELRSGFSGLFNYHFGTSWNRPQTKVEGFKNSFTDTFSFLDFFLSFTDTFSAEIQIERYHFGSLEKGNKSHLFGDIVVRYNMIPNKLSLTLNANNLFNTKTFANYSISDISVSRTEYRLLPRYLLLSASYRL